MNDVKSPWRELDYLSPKDIAEILRVHENTAYKVIHQMPFIKIGTLYRVPVPAFEKWLKDNERRNRIEA